MEKQSTYIHQIEAKDILISNNDYHINKDRKFKGTINYSLDTIKLDQVAKEKINKDIFYIEDGKQYCRDIVNLTFKYSVKEYNEMSINKERVYVFYDYHDNVQDLKFENGFSFNDKNEIIAIKPNMILNNDGKINEIESNNINTLVRNKFIISLNISHQRHHRYAFELHQYR